MASCNEPWVRLLTPCPLPSSAAEHRVLGHTQTHTWAAVSALSLKNETNISPSTISKVCIFQILPSATLGLNLRGYVFLFKHAVHIHLFRPRAFGTLCWICQFTGHSTIPFDIIALSIHDISYAWITHLSAWWLQSETEIFVSTQKWIWCPFYPIQSRTGTYP